MSKESNNLAYTPDGPQAESYIYNSNILDYSPLELIAIGREELFQLAILVFRVHCSTDSETLIEQNTHDPRGEKSICASDKYPCV